MQLTRRVKFHGVQLDGVAPEIVIRGVDPGTTKENITAADRLGGFGQRITGAHFQTLEAAVTFAIDIKRQNMSRREAVWGLIHDWAANRTGWLEITYDGRENMKGDAGIVTNSEGQILMAQGRRMYADKVIFPSSGDLFDWMKEYTITFRAYHVPFWQDVSATEVKGGVSASGTLGISVPGRVKTPVDITFQNMSGKTISNFEVWTGISRITLTDISLGGSETLTISHRNDGLMTIKRGGTSIYSHYTGSDDLLIGTGAQAVAYQTERAGVLTASVRGRYL